MSAFFQSKTNKMDPTSRNWHSALSVWRIMGQDIKINSPGIRTRNLVIRSHAPCHWTNGSKLVLHKCIQLIIFYPFFILTTQNRPLTTNSIINLPKYVPVIFQTFLFILKTNSHNQTGIIVQDSATRGYTFPPLITIIIHTSYSH